jgi:hypothetical protein
MTTTDPLDEIYTRMRESFGDLARNRIRGSVLDEFEVFVTAPGALTQPSLLVRCRIMDGEHEVRIVVDKKISRWRLGQCFVPFLRRALSATCGRAEFFVLISDTLHIPESLEQEYVDWFKQIPFLRCDRSTTDRASMQSILMPDFFMQDGRYGSELEEIDEAVSAHPFDQRHDVIMWRGSLSGSDYPTLENFRRFPRFQLHLMSLEHPDIIDARLCNYDFGDTKAARALSSYLEQEYGSPAARLPAAGFVPYKYLISLDGVGAAWKRTATILASGSVLLLHHRWTQFFYPGMKPWVHYVPLEFDFSDLIDCYQWLVAHPARARQIAENGWRFAKEVLTPRALETYFAQVLTMCCELYEP